MKTRIHPSFRKPSRSLGLAAFFMVLASALPAGESRITAVTVYQDRAVVTREAEETVSGAGLREFVFDGLPVGLMEQSLQVSGGGSAKATILDVLAKNEHFNFTPNERIKALEDEIKGQQKQLQVLQDRDEVIRQQGEFLGLIRAAATMSYAEGQARPGVEEWGKQLLFQQEQLTRLGKDRQTVALEREAVQDKVDALNRQIAELRGSGGGRSQKKVIVRLDAATAGTLSLRLSYTMPGARWTPSYDARLRTEQRVVELNYFGVVRNGTGEDWKDVRLTLSTARPSLGGGAPELSPWILDVLRPQETQLAMMSEAKADRMAMFKRKAAAPAPAALATGGMQEMAADKEEVSVAQASVESGASSATFRIQNLVTLNADNTAQKVPVARLPLEAKLEYQATPKLRESAYLTASATNTSDYPLLAGTLNSFLDESFVATGSLKSVMPGEKFDLALGADEGITFKRRLVNRFTETTGLTGKGARVTYEYLVTVTNTKKTPERVVFTEGLPIARDELIELKLLRPEEKNLGTKQAPKEVSREEDGKLVWRLDLKAGEKREITLKFQVDHPGDVPVTGLE